MESGDREFGVVEPAEDEVPLPAVAPETGIEPDAEAQAERTQTWAPTPARSSGDDTAGGA